MRHRYSLPAYPVVSALVAMLLSACNDAVAPVGETATMSSAPFVVAAVPGTTPMVYVSLPPASLPTATVATIRALHGGAATSLATVDGGFDPVPLAAAAGDTITISVVQSLSTAPLLSYRFAIPRGTTAPVVIRTDPRPDTRDASPSGMVRVVFSEPIDPATLTSVAIQLRLASTAIAGQLAFVDATHTVVEFTAANPLSSGRDYQLVVASTIASVAGAPLSSPVTVAFTTGNPVATVALSSGPFLPSVLVSGQVQLTATVRDAANNILNGRTLTWTSSAPAIATVSPTGLVTGTGLGSATITATAEGVAATATIGVSRPAAPVASVIVSPSTLSLRAGESSQLIDTIKDGYGDQVVGRPLAWSSNAPTIATISSGGMVTALGVGTATVSAISEGVTGQATITVTAVPGPQVRFGSVSAGGTSTCGVTTSGAAYCWGDNSHGQLGTGTRAPALIPTPVIGGLAFAQVSMGETHACGVATSGAAYCWGDNSSGQIGDGRASTRVHAAPVLVPGALQWRSISAGGTQTCGVTTAGAAYCWGSTVAGQLGVDSAIAANSCPASDGSTALCLSPVPVAGGLVFATVTAADALSCGVTTAGAAYCWGSNASLALGDGSTDLPTCVIGYDDYGDFVMGDCSPVPLAVTGGLAWREVQAMGAAACGIGAAGQVYCWGEDLPFPSNPPLVQPGTVTFAHLATGWSYGSICGIGADGSGYCWGDNFVGEFGNGTLLPSQTPAPVAGGLTFTQLASASAGSTCGITSAGSLYCWGFNGSGQLGNGTTSNVLVPVKVAGQP